MDTTEFEFDLTKYDVICSFSYSYLQVDVIENEYLIYEGAMGNKFNFYRVPCASNAGKAYKKYDKKYNIDFEKRFETYDEWKIIQELSKIDSLETLSGAAAYLKYWNDCIPINEKKDNNFYGRPHLEALKEWYNLNLDEYIKNNDSLYLNDAVRNADILRWKNETINNVGIYIKQSAKSDTVRFSSISSYHANELIQFYNWLIKVNSINKDTVSANTNITESDQYIDPALLGRLVEVESKMNPTIKSFNQSKIKCAAWVELLMDKPFFATEFQVNRRKSCIDFAKLRYDVDIKNQMGSGKKKDRETHKKQLSKYLN